MPDRQRKKRLGIVVWLAIDLGAIGFLIWQYCVYAEENKKPAVSEQPAAWFRSSSMHHPVSPGKVPALGSLAVDKPAPDFTLSPVENGPPVHLADLYAKKPVVLILSSFS